MSEAPAAESTQDDFIRSSIRADIAAGKNGGRVATRFPPEPNGCMHIGHANNICLNFLVAREFGGTCNLRFDDTNPAKEETQYVDSIQEDIRWLGFDWEDRLFYASDYFPRLHDFAVELIGKGLAYVDDLSADEIREFRGTLTAPGRESPHRGRTVEENLALFSRMRGGEFPDGTRTLRAKIDMASPNLNMRDPVMYRILHAPHHRTGTEWCIYPMYDFAHCVSDALEGITHSLCTLEFEDHRPLYDWFLDNLDVPCHPRQIEVSRSNLTHTVMSKRKLRELVEEGSVSGWDDPRMPTLRAMRRRGCTPEAILEFCRRVGISKVEKTSQIELLEHCLRDDLNKRSARAMAVQDPLRLVITDYPEGKTEELDAVNNPEDPSMGKRKVPFSRVVYVERADFMEDPPKKFHRLAVGREVRLRYAYLVTCVEAVKDGNGRVVELRCTHDPASRGGDAPDGRKVRGTIHWVSAEHAVKTELRRYGRLFREPHPEDLPEGTDWKKGIDPESLTVVADCRAEPGLKEAAPGQRFQFERLGYFCADRDTSPEAPVFNLTVTLRDSWSKQQRRA